MRSQNSATYIIIQSYKMLKKQLFSLLGLALTCVAGASGAERYAYDSIPGDPLHTRAYTLPNGLKLFMTVNRDEPRIQTYIAVRVGGKNDPAETTGLAHYFEHLMFKGTEQFGTSDYAAEKPMLDRIEQLFETYRHTTDSLERKAIYREIDSISYQASLVAIPNEYDKLMTAIGANGTNAYTTYDATCYVEDIPSNQIENWARIQADRFEHPVIRGFHTELETIYEEKNMSLTRDSRKLNEAMLTALFPSHPYGTQTVLGTQEQLKNPSITNVKNYHKQWYVPNNMAICLSGDFDPDEMVDVITKYFGHLKPNPALPVLEIKPEQPITAPIEREVFGPEAERIYLAWRIPAAAHDDMPALKVLSQVLSNNNCGLIDVDINLAQTMLGAGAGLYSMADQGALMIIGMPKPGQTLDQVRELLIAEVQKLLDGDFDDSLVKAIAANEKLDQQRALESNEARADIYVDAFVNGETLADVVKDFDAFDNITKDDVLAAARRYLGTTNYAAIYKRQGEDPTIVKLPKPELTPIATNRDASSAFLQEIASSKVEPIEPVFVDFDHDITRLTAKQDTEVLYTHNNSNDLFSLIYIYDKGTGHDLNLSMADVLSIAGTRSMTPEQVARAFYDLACSYRVVPGPRRTYVVLEGLSENMLKAMNLYETLIEEATVSPEAWSSLMDRVEQSRINAKSNQSQNFSRLSQYAMYGPRNSSNTVLDIDSLRAAGPAASLEAIRDLRNLKYRTIYYGTHTPDEVTEAINDLHITGETLADAPATDPYPMQLTPETIVLVAPYDAKQLYMRMVSNRGEKYDPETEPTVALYNEYFGGGMNSIVFQEMRESRSLAYSAWAYLNSPSRLDEPYLYVTMIATQNDKMADAIEAFDEIINRMPRSEAAFELAKQGLDSRIRTERTIKDNIAWAYINAHQLGLDSDPRRAIFEKVPTLTLDDIEAYQKANVAGRTYVYAILGDPNDLDMEALSKLGRVVLLSTEDIFGY